MLRTHLFSELSDHYPAFAILTASLILTAAIIIIFTERLAKMDSYLNQYQFLKNSPRIIIMLKVFYYIFLLLPVLCLIGYSVLLIVNVGAYPGVLVMLYGIFFIGILIPSQEKYYYVKVFVLFLLLIASQVTTLALNPNWETQLYRYTFYGLTAVLLGANGVVVCLILWLLDGREWSLNDSLSFIRQQFQQYCPIWKENPPALTDGGVYKKLVNSKGRRLIIFALYMLSLGILAAYSLTIYYFTTYQILACIISIAIVGSDIIIFLLVSTEDVGVSSSPNITSVVAMLVRIVMFSSSGDFWFIGYCVLYLVLITYISGLIIDKHYPKYDKIPNLDQIKTNLIKTPEFIGFIELLIFGCIIFYLYHQKQLMIPSTTLPIGEGNFPYWNLGIGVILISIGLNLYLCSVRIVQRKINRIKDFSKFYFCCYALSEYYIFQILSYAFVIVTGFYFHSIVDNHLIWLCTIFLPIIYQSVVVFYRNWAVNQFKLLGDVEKFNKVNQKLHEATSKIEIQRKNMLDQIKKSRLKQMMSKTIYGKRKEKTSKGQSLSAVYNISGQDPELSSMNLAGKQKSQVQAIDKEKRDSTVRSSEGQILFVEESNKQTAFQNWRETHTFCEAFWYGKLLPTDRLAFFSLIVLFIFLTCFSIIDYLVWKETLAFTISIEIVILLTCLLPIKKFFETLTLPAWYEFVLVACGVCLNYLYGGFALAGGWREQRVWIIWWGFVNALIILIYTVRGFLRDYGFGVGSIVATVIFVLFGVGMGIYVLLQISLIPGIIIIGVFFYAGYMLAIYLIYLYLNKTFPNYLVYITMGVFFVTAISVMIVSYILGSFDDFLGFSITYLIINIIVLGYGGYLLYSDISTQQQKPNFYSPYGLPVFKLDANIQSAVKNNTPTIIIVFGMMMLFFLTLLVQIFVNPVQIGVSLTVIFEIVICIGVNYFNNYNSFIAGRVADKISWRIIEQSWKEVKLNMLKLKQIEENEVELYSNFIMNIVTLQSQFKDEKDYERQSTILSNINDLQEKKQSQQQQMMLVAVNLEMTIRKKVEGERKKQITKMVNFINSKSNGLFEEGVIIIADGILNTEGKYYQIMKDFKLLSAGQQIKFERCFEIWCEEEEEKARKLEEQRKFQEQQKQKREAELMEKLLNLQPEDPNVPIDQMRDSLTKYRKIMESQKTNSDPYLDKQFVPSNDLITNSGVVASQISQWVRPTYDCFLIDDSNTRNQVKQGNLGDCFLISAIGILGLQNLKNVLGVDEWINPRGGYMVKFQKINLNIHSIVDDLLPVDLSKQWFLGHCQNQKQLYVNIIEKAYAKLYGSYINIIGGKVHIALSQLTGGFPSEINLELYRQKQLYQLFQIILKYFNNGYLLGAGSPENILGDKAISEDGIVQGHAYQIMNVRNIDDNKLIKLRNPHGKNSTVWTGDWSNNSVRWNARLKGLLDQEFDDYGTFWMSIDDFVYQYKSLYVCMIFQDKQWKTMHFKGRWEGKKAAGLPSKQNVNAKIENNPQYGVRVNKKSTLFLQLQQNQLLKSSKGKNYIFYMVQRNKGKRITKSDVQILCGKADSAQNSASLSGEIQLSASSYPYTFSIVAACINQGDTGSFTMRLYCNDENVEFINDSQFDV